MKKLVALLVFLISSVVITGISFIDGKIWETIFYILGLVTYSIVGLLFSFGIISTKKQGADAYVVVLFFLILGGFGVYKVLESIRNWILSWSLSVKILVPTLIILGIGIGIFFVVRKMIKTNNDSKKGKKLI